MPISPITLELKYVVLFYNKMIEHVFFIFRLHQNCIRYGLLKISYTILIER